MAKPLGTAMVKVLSLTSTSAVSFNHVSKFACERETWSSPSAARQTCFASIDGTTLLSGF